MTAADHSLERHYRFHLRQMAFGLAFSLALGTGMVLALIRPGFQPMLVTMPAVVFFVASMGLNMVVKRRLWPGKDAGDRAIDQDEWVKANLDRARKAALLIVSFGQVPLAFFVAYVPADPTAESAAVAMAILTMAIAQGAFFASYLLSSRQPADG